MTELCDVATFPYDVELKAQGWKKQFTCEEPRLSEMVELYKSMGREVYLIPMSQGDQLLGAECDACFVNCGDDMKTIWTRVRK